ncbi:MAG: ATP-binding protein [Ginsengibacter sp.]
MQSLKLQEQQRQQSIEVAKIRYRNKINLYAVIFASCVFLFIALLLWRNNKQRCKDYSLLQQQKSKTEAALQEPKSTQAQLAQKEKMASLGELTAGIAHEIKNPLNFINNFAELNAELLEELKEQMETDSPDKKEEKAIHEDMKQNLEKIIRHGRRADSIVKNMLGHSRNSGGVTVSTDINALADEYSKLAYNGIRAADKSFNAVIEKYFDASLSTPDGRINIVPQDIGRVLLNLFNNAFYAVNEKKKNSTRSLMGSEAYEPIVTVTTKAVKRPSGRLGVSIAVRDNGNGIQGDVVNKIFQPFYTTKPTGEGTGLGLSLSYDIATKAHGGELKINTKEGEYAEFVIELPG